MLSLKLISCHVRQGQPFSLNQLIKRYIKYTAPNKSEYVYFQEEEHHLKYVTQVEENLLRVHHKNKAVRAKRIYK